jgi:hypothetical protein
VSVICGGITFSVVGVVTVVVVILGGGCSCDWF